jgi:serine/threonine protein kinase
MTFRFVILFLFFSLTANVVLLMGVCESPLSCVTEYVANGSLHRYLRQNRSLTPELEHRMVEGIARGMLHLHLENIVHRDLAARNILLTESLEPKISDFVR